MEVDTFEDILPIWFKQRIFLGGLTEEGNAASNDAFLDSPAPIEFGCNMLLVLPIYSLWSEE